MKSRLTMTVEVEHPARFPVDYSAVVYFLPIGDDGEVDYDARAEPYLTVVEDVKGKPRISRVEISEYIGTEIEAE